MRTPKQLPAALNALLMTVKICTGAALLFVLAGCASPEEIAQKKAQAQAEEAQRAVLKKELAKQTAQKYAIPFSKLRVGMDYQEVAAIFSSYTVLLNQPHRPHPGSIMNSFSEASELCFSFDENDKLIRAGGVRQGVGVVWLVPAPQSSISH